LNVRLRIVMTKKYL